MPMIKIGQIGVGDWGKNLLRNFCALPGAQVVIACDANPTVLAMMEGDYPRIQRTDRPDDVIGHPDVDAVVIATLPSTHYTFARRALQNGKDVFVEKPFVLDVGEGEELVHLAETSGHLLMVGHLMEYHPALLQLKNYVTGGALGDLHYLYSTRVNLGKVRTEENALWSFAPHDISMVLFLLEQEPVRVTADGQCYLQPNIEDVVFATLHFRNGAMAHIHVSWLDPHKIRKLTVVGSRKMAVFDDTEAAEMIRIYDKGIQSSFDYRTYGESFSLRWGDVLIPRVKMSEPLREECAHFIQCVQERRTPRSDGRDGLRVLKVLEACTRSMKAGGAPIDLLSPH